MVQRTRRDHRRAPPRTRSDQEDGWSAEPPPARGPEPQRVLGPLTSAAIFLVATVDPGGGQTARKLLAGLGSLERAYGFGAPEASLSGVAAIGSDVWDRLFDAPRPAGLHPFRALEGPRHTAVSTPGDLLFHLRATRSGLCFALAAEIMTRLRGAVTLQDEVQGFKYRDVRDLMGFVDGTENPVGAAARPRGDFELRLGQDVSIGYLGHDATGVELYFQESFTFLVHTSEASVALRPAAG